MINIHKGAQALGKYREEVQAEDAVVLDFITPARMHMNVKARWKRVRFGILSLCQAAFKRRIQERNLRISSLLATIRSYANAHSTHKALLDFPTEVKTLIQATLQLRNRVELLRLEHSKLAKQ